MVIIVLSAVYGAILGLYPGGLQILYDTVKIPMLLLISLYITAPSFYVLTSLLGGKRSLSQVIVLLLSSLTVMSTILIALVPVNLFSILTTADSSLSTEAFLTLLNVLIFTLAGLFALVYLLRGLMSLYPGGEWKISFLVGSLIFMFVGTQLAWVLRPYFNYRGYFIGPNENNFYVAIFDLIIRLLRGGR